MSTTQVCNICKGTEFTEGPLGRLSVTGKKPCCKKCGSLERHRILRSVWSLIPTDYLIDKKALQFSLDPSVNPDWFKKLEVSIYEQRNSLDLQNIDRSDSTYNIVICNQILEHVADDKTAFSELLRVLDNTGILQVTVPIPMTRAVTEDWGYPRDDFHGHYRHYGIDLIDYFKKVSPKIHLVNVQAKDQVTEIEDYVFFWTKSPETRDTLLKHFAEEIEVERYF